MPAKRDGRGAGFPYRALCLASVGFLLSAVASCAPPLGTLQPAHVAPPGHVQATAGFEVGVPTGAVETIVDTSRSLAEIAQTQMITTEQKLQLLDAGLSLAASPPSFGPHFAAAYTPFHRTEVGLRYAVGTWRLGARYQLMEHETGPFDVVMGFGVGRSSHPVPVEDVLPVVSVEDVERWTFDVPLLVGTSQSWFRVWAGPKLLYSTIATAVRLNLVDNETVLATLQGHALYYGMQTGFAIGYRHVFAGLELTVARMSGSAAVVAGPTGFLDHRTDLSGLVIYPSVALMGEL